MRNAFQPARLITASPWLTLTFITVLTFLAAVGLTRLQFDDDYRSIFRADSPDFLLLEQTASNFGSDDTDVFVLLQGAEVIEPGVLRRLRAFHDRCQQIDGVASVYSILSLPALAKLEARGADGATAIREQRPALLRHPLVKGRLLSSDGRATILVVGLKPDDLDITRIRSTLERIREAAAEEIAGSPMRLSLSGIPALRAEIVEAIVRDQIKFNAVGLFLVGSLALLIFRRVAAVVLVGAPAVVGVIWTMGSLGLIGEEINVLNNVVPQLALVLGFSDSIHFAFHARRAIAAGMPRREAARVSLREVGFACVLTTLTTMLGFASLAWTQSPIIQSFGLTCALGAAMSFLAVVTLTPLLIRSPLGDRLGSPAKSRRLGWTDRWSDVVCRRARWVALAGCLLVAGFLAAAVRLEPDYRYTENLPSGSETSGTIALRDRLFGGSAPIHALIEWPATENALSPAVIETLEATEEIFESAPIVSSTTSALDLLRALSGEGSDLSGAVPYLSSFPAALERRFLRKDLRQALVTGVLPDLGAAELAPLFADLKSKFSELEKEHSGFRIHLVGLSVVSAQSSLSMISDLTRSLVLAALAIFFVLSVTLGSLRFGAVSILPNVLPLAGAAALLYWMGRPLQYNTVAVLTVGLGIAVDDTIHFLIAYRRLGGEGAPRESIRAAFSAVSPALVTTTLLLIAGFATLMVSETPIVRSFGGFSSLCFSLALLGDLTLLPALLALSGREAAPGHDPS